MSTAAGWLFRPTVPSKQFSVPVTFMIPMLAQVSSTMLWRQEGEQSCFRTNVTELVSSGFAWADDAGDDDMSLRVKQICSEFGVGPTESIYTPILHPTISLKDWFPSANAWTTEKGLLDISFYDGIVQYFMLTLQTADAFCQWSDLQLVEAKTIQGVKLNGWSAPRNVLDDYKSTFYATDDGVPKYLVLEGAPGNGALATVLVKFGTFQAAKKVSL